MPGLSSDQLWELFAQEAEVRLGHLGQLLLQLERTGGEETLIRSIFREIHTLKGSSAVAGLTEISACAHQLEELVDDLRTGQRSATPDLVDILLAGVDRLGSLIAGAPHDASDVGTPGDAAALTPPRFAAAEAASGLTAEQVRHVDNSVRADRDFPAAEAGGSLGASPAAPTTNGAAPLFAAPAGAAAAPAGAGPAHNGSAAPSGRPNRNAAGGVILVPTQRQELTRLVGQSASAHLRMGRMLKDRFGIDPASCVEFNEMSRSLNDLQDRATRTQMVPVATITDQLHRAVRDLSRAQGKDIRWDARGVDTEMDRGVLHQLSDSLLHLVRNAVDHGIETVAAREAAGKPAHGTIRLHAMQLGSEVIIAVTDDGRGIDTIGVSKQAARRRMCVVLPRPGSPGPTDNFIYRCAQGAAADVSQVQNGLTAGPVDWVGSARGEHVGLQRTATGPELVRSLITASTPVQAASPSMRRRVRMLLPVYRAIGMRGPVRQGLLQPILTDHARRTTQRPSTRSLPPCPAPTEGPSHEPFIAASSPGQT